MPSTPKPHAMAMVSPNVVKPHARISRGRAYPSSAAIFGLFVIYQIYSMFFIPSLLLAALTVFDIILIILILHEYRHKKRLRTA